MGSLLKIRLTQVPLSAFFNQVYLPACPKRMPLVVYCLWSQSSGHFTSALIFHILYFLLQSPAPSAHRVLQVMLQFLARMCFSNWLFHAKPVAFSGVEGTAPTANSCSHQIAKLNVTLRNLLLQSFAALAKVSPAPIKIITSP